MEKKYTREEIERIVLKVTQDVTQDTSAQFVEALSQLSPDQRNGAYADVIAISVAQGNAARIITEALCELLVSE